MNAAAGESRKTIAAETSASVPIRCMGIRRGNLLINGFLLSG
jgi:hypothetical protein